MRTSSLAALTLVAAVAVAGCDTGSASSAPGDSSGSGAASQSTPPTSSSGPKSLAPSPSAGLAIPHADPALEALLPAEFEGKPLTKLSVDPISAAAGGESIRALAKAIGDGSGNFALAYASNPADPTFNLIALLVPGAESEALAEGFAGLLIQDTRGAEADQVTLAGKPVTHVTAPNSSLGDTWFYVQSDTLFGVQARTPDRAAALLALLP
jgi:hypothetical protein